MNPELFEKLFTAGCGLLAFAVTWGSMRQLVKTLEKSVDRMIEVVQHLGERVHKHETHGAILETRTDVLERRVDEFSRTRH